MSKSPPNPQKEIDAYYASKKPYTELLQKALAEKKPPDRSQPQKYPFQDTNDHGILNRDRLHEMPNIEGLSLNYEAVTQAIADIRKIEEQENKKSRSKK